MVHKNRNGQVFSLKIVRFFGILIRTRTPTFKKVLPSFSVCVGPSVGF